MSMNTDNKATCEWKDITYLIIYITYLRKIVRINSLFILYYLLTTNYLITQLYRQYKKWQRHTKSTPKFDPKFE